MKTEETPQHGTVQASHTVPKSFLKLQQLSCQGPRRGPAHVCQAICSEVRAPVQGAADDVLSLALAFSA